jgi:hypothetical protein
MVALHVAFALEPRMTRDPAARIPELGVPAADLETSPIVGEDDDVEVEAGDVGGVCRFNGRSYPVGSFVRSGSEVLRCEPPGVWVREGELRPHDAVLD